ncbi:palmitoyl[protein] hydrolase [Synchytrium microbalum]|uniref:Palmitoyl-protein thioesterase 1 n=1 Tax=Synchytrium microbalum TaxID=1806994 RepID=A0A507CB19_9FUNG|nr:palmitoyl[protein] hydrolase [Synchytrium microbalum]TPX38257.1 palmitoyl[protein] hydrolase [Synchytrium microbalum]
MKLRPSVALQFLGVCIVAAKTHYRPVVLYHGLGDTSESKGMTQLKETLETELPGVYVKSIRIGNTESEDRDYTFIDNVNRQIDEVCEALADDDKLFDGFNAIGFSQGGLFLRGYIERCNDPPVHNLITFGTPHSGIAEIPNCPSDKTDITCQVARGLIGRGAYLSFVQERVVQAQYYKNPKELEFYLKASIFLADINNERDVKEPSYAVNMESLNKLVMVQFLNDTTVVPKETAWFGFYLDGEEGITAGLRDLPIYKEDWIGLKKLDKAKKLEFLDTEGGHMQFTIEFFIEKIVPYLSEPILVAAHHNSEDLLVDQN